MAKNRKNGASTKVFGGTSVSKGVYFIKEAFVGTDKMILEDNSEKEYDTLEVELFHDNNGVAGAVCDATLRLNGCWRTRRGSDDKPYKASGSFYTDLLAACQGKGFDDTATWITQTWRNRKISVDWKDYPSTSGGFGQVPVVEFV